MHFGLYPYINFQKRKIPEGPAEEPVPPSEPEIEMPFDPEDPLLPPEDPDFIPADLPESEPPQEIPPPAEGP